MFNNLIRSITMTAALVLVVCVIYPAIVTLTGKSLFPSQANGSFVTRKGKIIGSELIGQEFTDSVYFHARPSAIVDDDRLTSTGSNLGPLSLELRDRIREDVSKLLSENSNLSPGNIPVDLVTASASGLDPHISPAAAFAQSARVAAKRGVPEEHIKKLIQDRIEKPTFGLIGEDRVNVFLLNLDLDTDSPRL
jgi:K+-transporting ATPase ATPase C chain